MAKKPILFGPDNKPIRHAGGFFRRDAASRTGSMSNWHPRQIYGDASESLERESILSRTIEMVNDDPNAEGIIGTFATTIIGPGLKPAPEIDSEVVGITKEKARELEAQQKAIYKAWSPDADVGERMTDGEIQHLKARSLFGMGESFEILYMRPDGPGVYSLASQVVDPLRVATPSDLTSRGDIKQGIRLGKFGQPVSYFIKKPGAGYKTSSENFFEVPARNGKRWVVLHDFIAKSPEQVRGYPILAPALRFFRDLGDLLGAELTSNVVTAAMSVFIEDTTDPSGMADELLSDKRKTNEPRYQDIDPGEIWYGQPGQEPHLLSADRPGTTFDPFTRIIKKSVSMATGIPFPVLFKDADGVNFAGYRASMLEAWRVYSYHRSRIGNGDNQKKYTMLMEEAWLRGNLDIGDDFQQYREVYTNAEWYGAPKGDIEPFKAIQADIMKNKAGVKPLNKIIIEDGGAGVSEVTDKIEEETALRKTAGIQPVEDNTND